MALTPEQISEIKEQLREQVAHLPEDKKQQALAQIESLSPQAVESLVKQQQGRESGKQGPEKTIFRMIVDGDVQSYKIDENKYAISVLDIAPISKAHCIIIPKTAISDAKSVPGQIFSLAKKIAKKIELKLKAKSSEIQTESKFGEVIINVIPIYDTQLNINSPRTKAKSEELEQIALLIKARQKPKIEKIKIKTQTSQKGPILKLPRRIP